MALPKLYRKVYYSISAAIHSRIVRVRSRKNRRNREPPRFFRPVHAQRAWLLVWACACVSWGGVEWLPSPPYCPRPPAPSRPTSPTRMHLPP